MTQSGTFPKVDGDVLYAQDMNLLAQAPRYIKMGSFATVGSIAGNYINLGSVLISGNSLTNPCELQINGYFDEKDIKDGVALRLSGLSNTMTFNIGSGMVSNGPPYFFESSILLGSPFKGCGVMKMWTPVLNQNISLEGNRADTKFVANINTGSPLVILFLGSNISSNMTLSAYSINAFRGATQ